ncbi:MAG: anti-sigma factor antagonist [endosymbiont of Galathealinum brachiosum]|uniref:Anti-sigma factor antagonist n=1 Tax=endosymbiont of Galathealinum brachiosum TaxID=2200906 RepID=A0A370DJ77_9GAMM|nr:MAG: anti-sigma factor antagonist [endosymbiont of Galathealinum brachiosum]
MKYPVAQHLNYSVISLSGEIDLNESPNVRKQILAYIKKNSNLLIDLSLVEYIDSSGVASLVEGLQTARSKKINFALVGVSDSAMQVLQLARLDSVFTIYDSLDEVE